MLLLRPDARSTPFHDLLLEFKLVRPEELGMDEDRIMVMERDALAAEPPVKAALDKAAEQARRYRAGLMARYGETLKLRSWAVVSVGFRRLTAREVSD